MILERQKLLLVTCSRSLKLPEAELIIIGPWFVNSSQAATIKTATLVDYHWRDRAKLFRDNELLNQLYEEVLPKLADHLNSTHGVRRSVRYWRILIGPWLGLFIHILYDRWFQLRTSLSLHTDAAIAIPDSSKNFLCRDMREFLNLFATDEWNDSVLRDLAVMSNHDVMYVEENAIVETDDAPAYKRPRGLLALLKEIARNLQLKFQARKACSKNWVVLGSDIGEKFLQCSLAEDYGALIELPARSGTSAKSPTKVPMEDPGPLDNFDCFENVLRAMIPRYIPSSYTSEYDGIRSEAASLPKQVAGVLSSNSHIPDDVIKHWLGAMVEMEVPLYTVQHGGYFGIGRRPWYELHEIAIADKFLTWGWNEEGSKKILPVGYSKRESVMRTCAANSENRQILLVQLSVPRYSYWIQAFPVCASFEGYLDQQAKFAQHLSASVKKNLLIRLDPTDYGWGVRERWMREFSDLKIDANPATNFSNLVAQSRLVISTYNSTVFLQTLYHNVPTVIFWDPRLFELREAAAHSFDGLADVGIFFTDPDLACAHVNAAAEDIEGWWFSTPVQSARRKFCDQYVRRPA